MTEFFIIFATSFTIALSGALMPGPLLTVTISESARRGFAAGPLLMVGHSILELALVVAICAGLDVYLKAAPVRAATEVIGGFILLYLGVEMFRTAGGLSIEHQIGGEAVQRRIPVITGAVTSLANPYWTLWWATLGMGFMMKVSADKGFFGVAVFFVGHIAADFAWYSAVSFGVGKGAAVMRDSSYRLLIRACGVFLVIFGGWFLTTTKDFFFGPGP
jgi:threonine/homoserine/homoserine lactone efflux protein